MKMNSSKILIIYGPTSIGKTEVAYNIAKDLKGIVISADSMQVFKEMDIGTAKPPEHYLNSVSHYLINICNPNEKFNVGDFIKSTINIIENNKDKFIIIVGGTAMYIYFLINGIHEFPPIDNEVKSEVDKFGIEKLDIMLKKIDPVMREKIDYNDVKRRKRILAVFLSSGKLYSEIIGKSPELKLKDTFNFFNLYHDKEIVYDRINKRVENMFEKGWIKEVKYLLKRYDKDCYGFRTAIGYSEIIRYLEKKIDYYDMKDKIKKDTRNYAKKQFTWFNKFKEYEMLKVDIIDDVCKAIIKRIQ